jgi:quercetin dioxygenase-like cupin family protein
MMLEQHGADGGWQSINSEIRRKVLSPGERMMSMLIDFKKGGYGAEHAHPHEQLGFVLSGKIRMRLGGEEKVVHAGEQICVPGGVLHDVMALEDSLVLETFTPLRHDLLESAGIIIHKETGKKS